MGLGSTADMGCHLLPLAPLAGAASLGGTRGDESYMLISSVSSLKPTRRPLLGFGEVDGGGGLNMPVLAIGRFMGAGDC